MDAVVQAYLVHLMEAGRRALVPQYACHLRAGLRHLTYQVGWDNSSVGPALCPVRQAEEEAGLFCIGYTDGSDVRKRSCLVPPRGLLRHQVATTRSPEERRACSA